MATTPEKQTKAKTKAKQKAEENQKLFQEIQEMLDGLPSDAQIQLFRASGGGKKAFIETCSIDDAKPFPNFLERLRDKYGGGTYYLSFYKDGKYFKNKTLHIDAPTKIHEEKDEDEMNDKLKLFELQMAMEQKHNQERMMDEMRRNYDSQIGDLKETIQQLTQKVSEPKDNKTAEMLLSVAATLGPALGQIATAMFKRKDALSEIILPKLLESANSKLPDVLVEKLKESPAEVIEKFIEVAQKYNLGSGGLPPEISGAGGGLDLGGLAGLVEKFLGAGSQQAKAPQQVVETPQRSPEESALEVAITRLREMMQFRQKPDEVAEAVLQLVRMPGALSVLPEMSNMTDGDGAFQRFVMRFPEIANAGASGLEYAEQIKRAVMGRLGIERGVDNGVVDEVGVGNDSVGVVAGPAPEQPIETDSGGNVEEQESTG